jgi:nucleoside permease NupC
MVTSGRERSITLFLREGREIESADVGGLFGTKIVLNEFVAFIDLGKEQAGFSEISVAIATFALCGFANFGSLGIMVGGLATMASKRLFICCGFSRVSSCFMSNFR